MMKAGAKRKRTHQEVKDAKLHKANQEQEIAEKAAAFAQMEAKVSEMEAQSRNNQAAADILNGFVERGLAKVDANGNVTMSENLRGEANPDGSI